MHPESQELGLQWPARQSTSSKPEKLIKPVHSKFTASPVVERNCRPIRSGPLSTKKRHLTAKPAMTEAHRRRTVRRVFREAVRAAGGGQHDEHEGGHDERGPEEELDEAIEHEAVRYHGDRDHPAMAGKRMLAGRGVQGQFALRWCLRAPWNITEFSDFS